MIYGFKNKIYVVDKKNLYMGKKSSDITIEILSKLNE